MATNDEEARPSVVERARRKRKEKSFLHRASFMARQMGIRATADPRGIHGILNHRGDVSRRKSADRAGVGWGTIEYHEGRVAG